jgi:acyl dehydratase
MRFGLAVGDSVAFARTITDMDIALCAAITGDFDPLHMDADYARGTAFGARIAHGALVLGLCSTCASLIAQRSIAAGAEGTPASLGYDRVRFLRPAFVGDTLTARYAVEALDAATRRSDSRIEVANQRGETVLAGRHVMKWVVAA